jgi:hypothetical protein
MTDPTRIHFASQSGSSFDWKQAKVTSLVKRDDIPIKKTTVVPKAIYKVTFNTRDDESIGAIGIYFDPATVQIVGIDIRK